MFFTFISLSSAFLYCAVLCLAEELYDDCVEGGTDQIDQQQGGMCSLALFVIIFASSPGTPVL